MKMPLSEKQRGVRKGIVAGGVATVVCVVGSLFFGPELLDPESTSADKIAFSLEADVLIALWLGLSVGMLARHRFFTPEDIDGGGLTSGTPDANLLQANLQNTLEQSVLAVLVHLIWIVTTPVAWAFTVPVAVILFVVGRILFLRGYGGGAPSRAIGFALTFYPSMLMLVIILYVIIRDHAN
jgi:hypothetical protein